MVLRHVGFETFELAVYDAISNFNIGRNATLQAFEHLKIDPGEYAIKNCADLNESRIVRAEYQALTSTKSHRKMLRGKKEKKIDDIEDKEGKIYEPGGF